MVFSITLSGVENRSLTFSFVMSSSVPSSADLVWCTLGDISGTSVYRRADVNEYCTWWGVTAASASFHVSISGTMLLEHAGGGGRQKPACVNKRNHVDVAGGGGGKGGTCIKACDWSGSPVVNLCVWEQAQWPVARLALLVEQRTVVTRVCGFEHSFSWFSLIEFIVKISYSAQLF